MHAYVRVYTNSRANPEFAGQLLAEKRDYIELLGYSTYKLQFELNALATNPDFITQFDRKTLEMITQNSTIPEITDKLGEVIKIPLEKIVSISQVE